MKKITEVTVKKLFGVDGDDYMVELLPNEPVTFIYGINGIGKTTLLKLLKAVLIKDVDVLQSIPFESMIIKFDTEETLTVKESGKSYDYEWKDKNGRIEEEYILKDVFRVEWCCTNPLQSANPVQDEKELKTIKMLAEKKNVRISERMDNWYKIPNKLAYLQKKIKEYSTDETKRDLFIDVINEKSGLTDKFIKIDPNEGIQVFGKYGEKEKELIIDSLSTGEKNLLLLYFQLIYELPEKWNEEGMCLQLLDVDESIASMYPDWLIAFVANLQSINEKLGRCDNNNFQFLIATHSLAIFYDHNEMMSPMWPVPKGGGVAL